MQQITSPFSERFPLESTQSGGAIPPLKRGISAILARYPMKTRQMGAIPPLRYYLENVIARYGEGCLALAAKGTGWTNCSKIICGNCVFIWVGGFSGGLPFPKDPAVPKIVRVVNLLRVLFLVRRGDLLWRRTLCGHHFPGNFRHFSSPRRVHGVVNLGGVVKTLRRSNSLFLLSS